MSAIAGEWLESRTLLSSVLPFRGLGGALRADAVENRMQTKRTKPACAGSALGNASRTVRCAAVAR